MAELSADLVKDRKNDVFVKDNLPLPVSVDRYFESVSPYSSELKESSEKKKEQMFGFEKLDLVDKSKVFLYF